MASVVRSRLALVDPFAAPRYVDAVMRVLALSLAVVPFVAFVACANGGGGLGGSVSTSAGGSAGSSTTSASSTTSSTSTSSAGTGGATTTSSTTGTGGGDPCHWKNGLDLCGAGFFCNAQGCGDGFCAPVPTAETQNRFPVCGCDGVSYWNDTVAASHGMAVQGVGACAPPKTCGGVTGATCPAGAHCALHLADTSTCGGADLPGTCWAVPKVCPTLLSGWHTRRCGASACAGECDLIAADALFYDDTGCGP
jgi:hypothetical protein